MSFVLRPVLVGKPMPRFVNEHVLKRRLADFDRGDAAGERLDQLGQKLMAAGMLDSQQAIHDCRRAAKSRANVRAQGFGFARFHRDDITADASLVIVDFLIRRGPIAPADPSFAALDTLRRRSALNPRREQLKPL